MQDTRQYGDTLILIARDIERAVHPPDVDAFRVTLYLIATVRPTVAGAARDLGLGDARVRHLWCQTVSRLRGTPYEGALPSPPPAVWDLADAG